MDAGNTRLIIGTTTSGAEELAKKSPRTHVIAAFQTIPSEVLFPVFAAIIEKKRRGVSLELALASFHQRGR
jgi:hypothetical protein